MSKRLMALYAIGNVIGMIAMACGGAAAPTATPTKAPAAPAAATATRPAAQPAPTATAVPQATATPARATTPTATVPPPPTKPAGRVTIAITNAGAQSLDPIKVVTFSESQIIFFMYEGLAGPELDGSAGALLAVSWQTTENGATWTFKLRPGVKFHNGDPFTADDVKFSFERTAKDSIGSYGARVRQLLDSVEIVDPLTVRMRLKMPYAIFIDSFLAGSVIPVVPKGYLEKVGPAGLAKAPVGTAPFKLVDRRLDEFASFEAFDGHWRRSPFVKSATVRLVPEESVRIAMLKTGEADVIGGISPNQAQSIKDTPSLRVITAPQTSVMFMYLVGASKYDAAGKHVPTDSPWASKLVRQAANYAIDRDAIVKGLFRGEARPMITLVSPGAFGYNPNLKPYAYDPKKARELLAQAGYPNGFTTELYTGPQGAISFTEETAAAVAQWWNDVGIKASIQRMEFGTLNANVQHRRIGGVAMTSTTDGPDAWGRLYYFFGTRIWTSMWWDESVDATLDKAAAEANTDKRQALLQDLAAKDYENASLIWLVTGNSHWGVNSRILDWPQQRFSPYLARVDLLQLVR